jgi:hypothetical protein
MRTLIQYDDYTREDVHDIFDPDSRFTRSSGTWGFQELFEFRKGRAISYCSIQLHARACEGGEETEGVAEHRKRSKLSDYATARRERPTKAGEYATARRQRPADTGQVAKRVAWPTEQGSPVRPASDLWREHRNPVGKSASVEKAGQPGDSGESRRAFVSEPVAANRYARARC